MRKLLLVVGIAFEDGFFPYVQREFCGVHMFADRRAELAGELSKLCFGLSREWTVTKGSNSFAQLFNSRLAGVGHCKG
jgi:hypothetical protein